MNGTVLKAYKLFVNTKTFFVEDRYFELALAFYETGLGKKNFLRGPLFWLL